MTLSHYKLSLYNIFKHSHIFLESKNKVFVFVHMHMYSRYTIYQFIGKFRCLTISKRILNVPTFTLPDTQLPTPSHFPLKSYSPPDLLQKRQHPPAVLSGLVPEGVTSTTGLNALKNRGIITIPWLNIQTLHNRWKSWRVNVGLMWAHILKWKSEERH